jgi:A/G-specific adenine glycosylase
MRGDFSVFRKQLLAWFDREKRLLPWRTEPSLYRTVVSEFMLQQTQVDTVLPYFKRWMAAFPDFETLAAADEAQVLKGWEGLGYYSRARNLHKLARSLVEEGTPETVDGWLARPGVGPYTAAAIASIAQGIPEPVIDGNVIRVLARLTRDERPIKSAAEGRSRYLPLARELIDPRQPGDFNEAVMELGAVTCRKARPFCLLCPVREHCEALASGSPEDLPVIIRKASKRKELARAWIIDRERLLLHFNPENAKRLAGLAELPVLTEVPEGPPLLTRNRGISSEQVRESIFEIAPANHRAKAIREQANVRWVPVGELGQVALSAPHRRWIESLLKA